MLEVRVNRGAESSCPRRYHLPVSSASPAPADPRFRFHISPRPGRWLNDPNGPIAWGGRYHVFHQPSWGHAVSDDLVRWTVLADALPPTPGGPDRGGTWSGGTVIDGDRVVAMYTGVDETMVEQVVCVATSDGDLTRWQKQPEPAISAPPAGLGSLGFRDPYAWRDGDRWLCVMGAGDPGTAKALLYASADLTSWTYLGPLLERTSDPADPDFTGEMWECPFVVPVDGRTVLGASVWWQERAFHAVAFVGDIADDRFTPSRLSRLDHGPDLYAPTAMIDASGRCLMWGWSWEAHDASTNPFGRGGVLTVPRRLTVHGDDLRVDPIEELATLRGTLIGSWDDALAAGRPIVLSVDAGPACDLEVTAPADLDRRLEVELLASADGAVRTVAFIDPVAGTVGIDTRGSARSPFGRQAVYAASVPAARTPRSMRILVDGSIVEAFIDGQAFTARVPVDPSARGVRLVVDGDVVGVLARLWSVTEQAVAFAP